MYSVQCEFIYIKTRACAHTRKVIKFHIFKASGDNRIFKTESHFEKHKSK